MERSESLQLRVSELEKENRELREENQALREQLRAIQDDKADMRKRQARGIANAKSQGVRFGRPSLAIPPGFDAVCQRVLKNAISVRAGAAELGVSANTFRKWMQQREEETPGE